MWRASCLQYAPVVEPHLNDTLRVNKPICHLPRAGLRPCKRVTAWTGGRPSYEQGWRLQPPPLALGIQDFCKNLRGVV